MNPFAKRLQDVADYIGVPMNTITKNSGYADMTMWRVRTDGRYSEHQIATAVVKAYPELNYKWLITGEGDMWSVEYFENRFKSITSPPKDNAELIKKLCKAFSLNNSQLAVKVAVSRSTIMRIDNGEITALKERTVAKFRQKFPFIPKDWFVAY